MDTILGHDEEQNLQSPVQVVEESLHEKLKLMIVEVTGMFLYCITKVLVVHRRTTVVH